MADVAGSVNKPSKSVEVLGVTLFLTIFGASFVLARLWARLFSLKSPGWDDILIAVALAAGIAGEGCTVAQVAHGFGVSRFEDDSLNIPAELKLAQFAILCNGIAMSALKTSVGLSLLRLQLSRTFNVVVWVSIVISLLVNLTVFPGTFASCRPMARTWNRNISGKCWPSVVNTAFSYMQAVGNILTDLIFTFGPLVYLSKVKVSKHNRWALRGIFLVGLIATACATAKATELPAISKSVDPTYDTVNLTIWVKAELSAGLMAASIPPLKRTFEKMLSRWFGVVKEYSTSGRTPEHTRGPSRYSRGYTPGTFASSRTSAVRGHKLDDEGVRVGESYFMTDRPKRGSEEAQRFSLTEDQRHILQESRREIGSKGNSITKMTEYSVSSETMKHDV